MFVDAALEQGVASVRGVLFDPKSNIVPFCGGEVPPYITEDWRREAVFRGFIGKQLVSCADSAPLFFASNFGRQFVDGRGLIAFINNKGSRCLQTMP